MNNFHSIYKKSRIWVLLALAIAFPFIINNRYVLHLSCLGMMYAMMTISLNILSGFTGLMSVGQIAFFGIGAYTTAILTTKCGMPVGIGILAAGLQRCSACCWACPP